MMSPQLQLDFTMKRNENFFNTDASENTCVEMLTPLISRCFSLPKQV